MPETPILPEDIVFHPDLKESLRRNAIAARLLEEDVVEGISVVTMVMVLLAVDEDKIKFLNRSTDIYLNMSNKLREFANELSKFLNSDPLVSGNDRFVQLLSMIAKGEKP